MTPERPSFNLTSPCVAGADYKVRGWIVLERGEQIGDEFGRVGEVGVHLKRQGVTVVSGPDEPIDPGQSSTARGLSVYNMECTGAIREEAVRLLAGPIRALVVHNQDFQVGYLWGEYLGCEPR